MSETTTPSTTPAVMETPKPTNGNGKTDPEKLDITSEQLNVRLERKGASTEKALLEQLGVKTIDEAKTLLQKLEAAEAEKLSEKERLEKELDKSKKEAETYKAIADRNERDAKADKVEKMIEKAALKAGVDPDDLDLVMPKAQAHVTNTFDKDHDLSPDDLKGYFEELKKVKPKVFKVEEVPVSTGSKGKAPEQQSKGTVTPKTVAEINAMPRSEYIAYKKSMGY